MLRSFFRPWGAVLLAASVLPAAAANQLLVIGDSLTKEYEVTYPGVPAASVPGIDADNPGARNWVEILNVQRNADFDLGIFKNAVIFNMWDDMRLLGHEYNWAVPGATARAIRNLLTGQNTSELTSDANFALLTTFAANWQQSAARITVQLQSSAEGVVIFCGGNDLRYGNSDPSTTVGGTAISYGTIYNGNGTGASNPQPLMDSIKNSIQAAITFVRAGNPTIPLAVCAVPHIGCTPDVQSTWPTDAVKTAKVTVPLEALNAQLKTFTETTGNAVWVEASYTLTKSLITQPLVIGGVTFTTAADPLDATASTGAHNRYVFAQDGFHPTTGLQGLLSQSIQAALKAKYVARYGASAAVTDRDVVVTAAGIAASTGFTEFMAASGVAANLRAPLDDPEGDGIPNLMEFALAGLAPQSGSPSLLPVPMIVTNPAPSISLTWKPRYPSNIYCSLVCQQSATLQTNSWTDVTADKLTANGDGTITARIPLAGGPFFLRLKATVTP